jgi:hypothetical protein
MRSTPSSELRHYCSRHTTWGEVKGLFPIAQLRDNTEEGFAMRTMVLTLSILCLIVAGMNVGPASAQAVSPWPWSSAASKPLPDGEPAPLVPRVQGDTMEDPFIMPAVPFSITGNTCGFNQDYDVMCPYGSMAPDVVYKYVCEASVAVDIDLCASTYDTKVILYEDSAYNFYACNDDYCAYQSYINNLALAAGHVYYIVVGGYGQSCGDYSLDIDEHELCVLECPPGAMPEGEPDCYTNYEDTYNGGCSTGVFQMLEPSCDPIVICGTTGVFLYYDTALYRDTDWFQIDLTATSNICLAGDSEIPLYYFIIDGRGGCAGMQIVASAQAGPCEPMSGLCHSCEPGTWWLWTGAAQWDLSFACGSVYWMEITGYTNDVSPSDHTTWGDVKGLFR